jgi:uncharacterized protein
VYEVHECELGKGVRSARAIEPGEVVMTAWGQEVPERTRHSIQVGREAHLLVDTDLRLINHSCDPNCGLLIRREVPTLELHALRPIGPGEALTLDYATFEDEIQFMTGPCLCGAPTCRGRITGFSGLTPERRDALRPYLAEHLLDLDAPVSLAG